MTGAPPAPSVATGDGLPGPAAGRRRLGAGLVLLLLLALAVLLKLSVWSSPLTRVTGVVGQVDPFDAIWFLRWTPWALGHGINPLTSDYLNYPTGLNLMWNTWMPAVGAVMWPVTALGGAVLADNVVSTLGLALSGFLAFLVLRRWVPSTWAAAAGGLLYGFSPYMAAQNVSHAQMTAAAVLLPVGLLLLDELLVRQRLDARLLGLGIGIAGVLEFLILEEYFVTELMAATLLTAILALNRPREVRARLGYALTGALAAAVVMAAALAYPLDVQLRGPNRASGVLHDPTAFVTDLANLVVPTQTQWIAPGFATSVTQHFTANLGEWDGYLGIGLLLLAVGTVAVRRGSLAVRSAGLFALCMTVVSLGPYLHVDGQQSIVLPFWVITRIPLVRDVQAGRLMVYVYLALALLLGVALEGLWRQRRGALWVGLACLVALVPLIPAPIPAQPVSTPAYFTSPAVDAIPAGTGVLTIPCPCPYAPAGLVWQTASGLRFRIAGGYFLGPTAPGQSELQALAIELGGTTLPVSPDAATAAAFREEMHASGVGAVVMAQVPHQQAAAAVLTGVLGFSPQTKAGVDLWLLPPNPVTDTASP